MSSSIKGAQPVTLRPPYLIFMGTETNKRIAKTGLGIAHWRHELCLGQIRLSPETISLELKDMTVSEAAQAGAKSLIIGVAAVGGAIQSDWIAPLTEALEAGMDVVGGLHTRLTDDPILSDVAARSEGKLIDVRVPSPNLPVGTGEKRSGKRVLMVGTDCAVGKKYTALALADALQTLGVNATFRASGQTGIMIASQGIAIDSVVSDFVSGAAELLSPENATDHWDVIEGQGSLFHPGYAAVSLGLLHGSQPDAIVVCTDPLRQSINLYDDYPIVDLQTCIDRNLEAAHLTNPDAVCVGISANTSQMSDEEAQAYLDGLSKEYGLPAIDPVRTGAEAIARKLANLQTGHSS